MMFSLTCELIDEIISAMENQEKKFAVNAKKNELVEISSVFLQNFSVDEENFYCLPEWRPADGFSLREEFVNQLHSPLAHDELQSVLHSGRGVFKSFRNVIKKFPEIERRWHIFKHRIMSLRINEWYNNLREIWGLERLEQLCESDDTSVYDDFSFREYNPSSDKKMLLLQVEPDSCCCEKLPFEVNNAIYEKLYTDFEKDDSENQIGFVCFSHSDEFAGCITVSQMAKKQKDVMIMTGIFVPEQFRGLGICTELIQMCVSKLQAIGKKWIFIPDLFVPEILQPLLIRTGFEKIYSGYILDLNMA